MSEATKAGAVGAPGDQRRRPAGGDDQVGLGGVHDGHGEGALHPAAGRPGRRRPGPIPSAMPCSTRWARTSVSVSERSSWPAATSSSPSSTWFSMIPLWTRASAPVQSVWGWALGSDGPAVGGPAGVADARGGRRRGVADRPGQLGQLARPPPHPDPVAVDQGHARRVVAPVLQAAQAVEEERGGPARARSRRRCRTCPRLRRVRRRRSAGLTDAEGPASRPGTRISHAASAWPRRSPPRPSPGRRARCRWAAPAPGRGRPARPRPPRWRPSGPRTRRLSAAPGGHRHVAQHLGQPGHRPPARSASGRPVRTIDVEHLQAGEDAVAGGGQVAEDDVARLLAAERPAAPLQRLEHVAVADVGLDQGDARVRPWPGGSRGWPSR